MNTKELLSTADNSLLYVITRPDIVMESGKGMRIKDTEGKEYLDFIGGWAVNCLGHSPKVLVEAISQQAETLINCSPAFNNRTQLEFAELLIGNCSMDRVFFMSTGAEANEGAIKLARKYGLKKLNGATDIITTQNSFHGRTMITMAATGKDHWQTLYGEPAKGFKKAVFNDLESMKALVDENTCAIMLEPVQGEGGVNVASQEYIEGLRSLCDEAGILLIFDEVQTGFGRCGTLYAYEHYGVEPDIITLGKGLGGGYPLSAMLTKEQFNIFERGDQGGTYTGQPLGMAVGHAVLKTILEPGFLNHVKAMEVYIKNKLSELSGSFEIENIRGLGLLLAFDLQQSQGGQVASACMDDGLIINSPNDKSIRLIPPLIVTESEVDEMLDILCRHLKPL